MIGKLKRVKLRDVWRHEAKDFTAWLEDNIEVLSESVDFNLSSVEREKSAGDFNVDLVGEDDSGSIVIIENQLDKSNHDHLGKVITYLSNLDAKAAIWIVSEPRPEHVRAITWLNEASSASFYLFKVEAVKIGDSDPAPLLTKIVGPSEAGKIIGDTKKDLSDRNLRRRNYWSRLLDLAKTRSKLHANISPSTGNYVGTGAGISGLGLTYVSTYKDSSVELYIDRGQDADEENLKIFDSLQKHQQEIEKAFGSELSWQRLEQRRACRIRYTIPGGYEDEEDKWSAIHTSLVDAMIRLEKSLRPHLKQLKL